VGFNINDEIYTPKRLCFLAMFDDNLEFGPNENGLPASIINPVKPPALLV
jgi:hypothetical protein